MLIRLTAACSRRQSRILRLRAYPSAAKSLTGERFQKVRDRGKLGTCPSLSGHMPKVIWTMSILHTQWTCLPKYIRISIFSHNNLPANKMKSNRVWNIAYGYDASYPVILRVTVITWVILYGNVHWKCYFIPLMYKDELTC